MNRIRKQLIALAIITFTFCTVSHGEEFASNKLAWSENGGWINLDPTHHVVTIETDSLSGFAWAENIGWIKFGSDAGPPYANTNAMDWGVNRDEVGKLSGFAWGENIGWINFDPMHGGAVFDTPTQSITGFVWSENVGWIHFDNYEALFSDGFEDL